MKKITAIEAFHTLTGLDALLEDLEKTNEKHERKLKDWGKYKAGLKAWAQENELELPKMPFSLEWD